MSPIGYHHSLLPSRMTPVAIVVSIANQLAKISGLCFPWDDKPADINVYRGWELLKGTHSQAIDVDRFLVSLGEEIVNVKNSVTELLS